MLKQFAGVKFCMREHPVITPVSYAALGNRLPSCPRFDDLAEPIESRQDCRGSSKSRVSLPSTCSRVRRCVKAISPRPFAVSTQAEASRWPMRYASPMQVQFLLLTRAFLLTQPMPGHVYCVSGCFVRSWTTRLWSRLKDLVEQHGPAFSFALRQYPQSLVRPARSSDLFTAGAKHKLQRPSVPYLRLLEGRLLCPLRPGLPTEYTPQVAGFE